MINTWDKSSKQTGTNSAAPVDVRNKKRPGARIAPAMPSRTGNTLQQRSFSNMDKFIFQQKRKSHVEISELYFWTATINQWQRLLESDQYKDAIIDSLHYLTDTRKVDVLTFIIMPNHIHLIWRVDEPNGNETPQGSFLKYTAHLFKKKLQKEDREKLKSYKVDSSTRNHEFCPKDSLGGKGIL